MVRCRSGEPRNLAGMGQGWPAGPSPCRTARSHAWSSPGVNLLELPLQLQLPWLPPPAGSLPTLLWVVFFCAAVDFLKLLVELLGRAEDRRFRSDPSQVTAVIASRDGAELLPATVEALAHLVPPERVIVVDDGSTDDTSRVARELGCRVFRFSRSKGKASAINFAVHRVETPFTLILDDD